MNEEKIVKYIKTIKKGRIRIIGKSAGNRNLYGYVYEPEHYSHVFGVIGGMHGHEPGGVASAFNLINILEEGKDLKNKKCGKIFGKIKFVIVPLLNPDGRVRCPDSFVGLSYYDIRNFGSGIDLNCRPVKREKVVNIKNVSILGGLYNDNGIDIINYKYKNYKNSPEIAYCIDFFKKEKIEYFINFHAHCFNILFYSPHNGLKEKDFKKELFITGEVRKRGKRAGYSFSKTEYEMKPSEKNKITLPSDLLVYNHCKAIPFLIECPQGTIDTYTTYYGGKKIEVKDPGYNHKQIVNSYLFVVQEINEIVLSLSKGEILFKNKL